MQRIGIFGGTFDPVHVEHVQVVKCAIKELQLDKLLVMPTYQPPHKSTLPSSAEDRINMLKIALDGIDKVEISTFEIDKKGKSYTYQTVEHFKSLYECELFFIVGADMLIDFKTWRYPERIMAVCTLATFGREDFTPDYKAEEEYFLKNFNKSFVRLNYVGTSSSSTKIRVYNWFNLDLSGLTADGVIKYIKDNNLYKGDVYCDFVASALPQKRLIHTASVVITALSKAKSLGLDADKVRISATLHDVAKYLDHTKVSGFSIEKDVPQPVIHAFLGAFVAKKMLGITDEEILDAIAYHTSGKANMTTLGKLIFVADMVEECRTYEGVDYLRHLFFEEDFEKCFTECLREEYIHLQNKKQYIYGKTLEAVEYYVKDKN